MGLVFLYHLIYHLTVDVQTENVLYTLGYVICVSRVKSSYLGGASTRSLPSSPSNKQSYEREHENETHSECGALQKAECPDSQAYAWKGERNLRNPFHEQARKFLTATQDQGNLVISLIPLYIFGSISVADDMKISETHTMSGNSTFSTLQSDLRLPFKAKDEVTC
jgi:hypothetical protein